MSASTASAGPAAPVRLLIIDDEPDLELMRQKFRRQQRRGEYGCILLAAEWKRWPSELGEPQRPLVGWDSSGPARHGPVGVQPSRR